MKRWEGVLGRCAFQALVWMLAAAVAKAAEPGGWSQLVQVEGQDQPVPAHWLKDPEARIAHELRLPASVPRPVPFDFQAASRRAILPGAQALDVQYFLHLCTSEAGEWIFRREQNVQGFYFARPIERPTADLMTDPHGPEMPWIQRTYMLGGNDPRDQAGLFVAPPVSNYHFVEQPNVGFPWQASLSQPFVRLSGMTYEPILDLRGNPIGRMRLGKPMQAEGMDVLSSRFGYTWRGLRRPRDREHGIAGGEALIYDLQTKEVLAVRRQFLKAAPNPRGGGKAMWEVAASCQLNVTRPHIGEFADFAFDVLQTDPPSRRRR